MKGGVAKTYVGWQVAVAPFTENNKDWYITLIHPKTGCRKTVRWWTIPSKIAGQPAGMERIEEERLEKLRELHNFTTIFSSVWLIEERFLSDKEHEMLIQDPRFKKNAVFGPQYGDKEAWWQCGCWICPESVLEGELPKIASFAKWRLCSWKEFAIAAFDKTIKDRECTPEEATDSIWYSAMQEVINIED